MSCGLTDDAMFPRKIGGASADTKVTCFDYYSSTTKGRLLVGGSSSSTDFVTHADCGFLTYEDTLSY